MNFEQQAEDDFDEVVFDATDCEEELSAAITNILKENAHELESLCWNFIKEDDPRYTVDSGSVAVIDVWKDAVSGWKAHLEFTVSAYKGCSDMNVCGDDCDAEILIEIDSVTGSLKLKARKRVIRDTHEEF